MNSRIVKYIVAIKNCWNKRTTGAKSLCVQPNLVGMKGIRDNSSWLKLILPAPDDRVVWHITKVLIAAKLQMMKCGNQGTGYLIRKEMGWIECTWIEAHGAFKEGFWIAKVQLMKIEKPKTWKSEIKSECWKYTAGQAPSVESKPELTEVNVSVSINYLPSDAAWAAVYFQLFLLLL